MPNSATEKLLKILRLEAQTGYQDKAVTRGLQSFTAAWLADATRSGLDPHWAESIAQDMRKYSTLDDVSLRQAALEVLINRLRAPKLKRDAEPPPPEEPTRAQTALDAPPTPTTAAPVAAPLVQPTRARRAAASTAPRRSESSLGLDSPVTRVHGIGEFNAQKLAKLGIRTIGDLLYYFPFRYDDYSALKTINQLRYGDQVTVVGRVASACKQRTRSGLLIFRAVLEDESGAIECSWFTNDRTADYMAKQLVAGREMVISGKVGEYLGRLVFQNPTYEPAEKEWITGGSIVPVYSLTEGLQPLMFRRIMRRITDYWPQRVPEHLPDDIRRQAGLMTIQEALREIHFPQTHQTREAARRRLAFDELFILQLAVLLQRNRWRQEPAPPIQASPELHERLVAALPYRLTGAQQRALDAILADMAQPRAMHRLLQGDVGSGKTVVAALAMALAASAGYQAALMAPTEILAEQHYQNIRRLLDLFAERAGWQPPQISLLTGSLSAANKREVYEQLATGQVQLVIGTHALIQERVQFQKLGLAVIDEQHRFGVEQRASLRRKAGDLGCHTLVMTATPIPRTLALTLYGDLDNTILDEMPPGRQPVETHWIAPSERERAYAFVRSQIAQGRQAFIICPLVEESEKTEAKAAVEEHERLQRDIFPDLKLGLLHGKMKPADKDAAMRAFVRGETHILVSTAVVEVGIDVPNASVMLIEGANRFGLAQLHQFRGRVGRGAHQSYCLLFADSSNDLADQRLQAIVDTHDGFKLAEIDLAIRGPGEFFGTRQSGEPQLRLVSLSDRDLLEQARALAEQLLARDPHLEQSLALSRRVAAFWRESELT
ncbi:MAG: ATP-dependent DNA helicase RecG [Thermoflexales bacterium]